MGQIFVQNILHSPMKFYTKVSTMEEMSNLDMLIVDKLNGILTMYEMVINIKGTSKVMVLTLVRTRRKT